MGEGGFHVFLCEECAMWRAVRDKEQSHTYVRIHKNVLTDEGCGSGPHESGKVRLSVSWVPMGSLLDVQPMRGFDHFVCMSNLRVAHA